MMLASYGTVKLTVSALWALAAGGVTWCALQAAGRMTYVTLADGQRKERRLPFLIRLVLPLTPNVTGLFDGAMFAKARHKTERTLIACGLDEVMTARDFLGLRLLVPVVLGGALVLLIRVAIPTIPWKMGQVVADRSGILYGIALLLAYVYPISWLKRELAMRHREVQRELPFILDLLTLSVEAGLDFMSAVQRILHGRQLAALGEELARALREIQLGKTRRQALHDMAERIDHSDIYAVTSALIHADEMGVSLGSILRIQADQIRLRRFQRAEKLAHEAPVKMLFPLIFFIFPAVFLVLLGPVFLEMARQWM